jgi:hypothetical protein
VSGRKLSEVSGKIVPDSQGQCTVRECNSAKYREGKLEKFQEVRLIYVVRKGRGRMKRLLKLGK